MLKPSAASNGNWSADDIKESGKKAKESFEGVCGEEVEDIISNRLTKKFYDNRWLTLTS